MTDLERYADIPSPLCATLLICFPISEALKRISTHEDAVLTVLTFPMTNLHRDGVMERVTLVMLCRVGFSLENDRGQAASGQLFLS